MQLTAAEAKKLTEEAQVEITRNKRIAKIKLREKIHILKQIRDSAIASALDGFGGLELSLEESTKLEWELYERGFIIKWELGDENKKARPVRNKWLIERITKIIGDYQLDLKFDDVVLDNISECLHRFIKNWNVGNIPETAYYIFFEEIINLYGNNHLTNFDELVELLTHRSSPSFSSNKYISELSIPVGMMHRDVTARASGSENSMHIYWAGASDRLSRLIDHEDKEGSETNDSTSQDLISDKSSRFLRHKNNVFSGLGLEWLYADQGKKLMGDFFTEVKLRSSKGFSFLEVNFKQEAQYLTIAFTSLSEHRVPFGFIDLRSVLKVLGYEIKLEKTKSKLIFSW